MTLALVVFVSMFVQDTAAAAKIEFLGRGHPWLAGYCEMANDWGAVLSIGIGGASVWHSGFSAQTIEVFVALGLAAVFGTRLGSYLTERWSPETGMLPGPLPHPRPGR